MISVGYPWGENFQLRLLALLVREPEKALGVVEPEYFTSPILTEIARITKEAMPENRHFSPVSRTTLRALVKAGLGSKKRETWPVYRRTISRVFRVSLQDKEILFRQALEYARESKHRKALVQAEKDISAHKYELAYKRIQEARTFGKDTDLGIRYWEGIDEKNLDKFSERWLLDRENLAKTGFKNLDRSMGGGLGGGEFAIALAGGKVGKTTLLANISANCLHQRKNVAIASGELSGLKYRRRIDALLTDVKADSLVQNAARVRDKLRYIRRLARGELYIKQFPTGKASVEDIERWLDDLEENEISIDMLAVDYILIFQPKLKQKERRFTVGQTAVELRGIAVERNIPVWTATQSNRAALHKVRLYPQDLAEDISQFWTVDFLIAVCQTKWEAEHKPDSFARMYIAAARDVGAGARTKIAINRETYKIREEDYPDEREE